MKMEYSVVIPVFNEEENLETLHEKVRRVMQEVSPHFEVIYVDDKSTDESMDILKEMRKSYPEVKIVALDKHQGQSCAFFAGFREAKGEWIITLDADLQNDPRDIKTFVSYKKGFDFITGVRKGRKDSSLRLVSSRIAYLSRRLVLGDRTRDVGCSLRLFRRKIVDFMPFFNNFHRFFTLLVREMGYKVKEIEVIHHPRQFGKSKYGVANRLFQGLFDLWGVFWLKRRLLRYRDKAS